ncbi:MAG: diaminopropionate ammonia-lyase [Acidimicrobiia bacterium]
MSVEVLVNPGCGASFERPSLPEVIAFHRRLPGYSPTRLVSVPVLAERLGVSEVLVKAETARFGLPSFKILGASWAIYRATCDRLGREPAPWTDVDELAAHFAGLRPFALATATDGNHGRAVAHMARLLGFEARIFVPAGTVAARIAAIRAEGAQVTVVDGDYDAAVHRAADEASDRCLVISDTSWQGYETTPARVIEGYSTIFVEIDDALAGRDQPTTVVVPVGVGALMAAAVRHYAGSGVHLVGVEPEDADCVLESVRAGHLVTVPGPHRSVMVGLNCGTPSFIIWPELSTGVDAYVSVDDTWAYEAVRALAEGGVIAGETGAAATAAMLAVAEDRTLRAAVGLIAEARVLLLCTEGPTG